MKLTLPKDSTIGSMVGVKWNVKETKKRSGHELFEDFWEGTILEVDGSNCRFHFDYNPNDETWNDSMGAMKEDITINLVTGIDNRYNGLVEAIRPPVQRIYIVTVDGEPNHFRNRKDADEMARVERDKGSAVDVQTFG